MTVRGESALSSERKKVSKAKEPEIPITPMLDMAFQLLTFFVLTYQSRADRGFDCDELHPRPARGGYERGSTFGQALRQFACIAPHTAHDAEGDRAGPSKRSGLASRRSLPIQSP